MTEDLKREKLIDDFNSLASFSSLKIDNKKQDQNSTSFKENQHSKVICVLGMHRSGTSALMGVLYHLGLYLGSNLLNPAQENPKGFFENRDIVKFNDKVLKEINSSWDDVFLLPSERWANKKTIEGYKNEAIELINKEFSSREMFGVKDPRMCILLPLWQQIFKKLHIDPFFIIIIRNPLEVAESLYKRNDFSMEKSMILWMRYMLDAEFYTRELNRAFVSFDELLKNPEDIIKSISNQLNIDFPINYKDVSFEIKQFLEPKLKHHNISLVNIDQQLIDMISDCFSLLIKLKEKQNNDVLLQFDSVKREFNKLCDLFYNNDIINQRKSLEQSITGKDQHIAQLEQAISTKDQHIVNLGQSITGKDQHIAQLEQAISTKDQHIATLTNDINMHKDKAIYYERHIRVLNDTISNYENTLNQIYNSTGWKLIKKVFYIIDHLFPEHSKRRKIYNKIRKIALGKVEENIEKENLTQVIQMYCDRTFVTQYAIEVTGWAISHSYIDRIEVYFDNILLGHATYGLSRPDVEAAYPFAKNSGNSGFSLYIVQEKIVSFGKHNLLIKAIDKEGESAEVDQQVDIHDNNYQWMRTMSERFVFKPFISFQVIMTEENHAPLLRSIQSIIDQPYSFWDINLFYEKNPPKNIMKVFEQLMNKKRLRIYPVLEMQTRLSESTSDFIGFILQGGSLTSNALFEIVKRLNLERYLELIYTDENIFVNEEKQDPFFKPDWSPDLLLSMNYIGQFFLLKRELLWKVGGLTHGASADGLYDLLLRVTEHTNKIGHISSVLYESETATKSSYQIEQRILEEALIRRGIKGKIIPLKKPGTYRVKREILDSTKVSIIILTAYKSPDLFWACLHSIVERSSYKNYEILFVDNSRGSLPLQELKQLIPKEILYKTIEYQETFNFSRMNNLAVKQANGDFLVFLNDDTEVISPEWIESMLEHAQRPEVGVVGTKLLYQDDTIQHAGVIVVDTGCGARHAFRFASKDAEGYHSFLNVTRNYSAVTFACVMVSKKVFLDLDGLDENLRVEGNDFDYCLRAIAKGYLVVWTPFAILYHRELTSRKITNYRDDIDYLWGRWRHVLEKGDPYYNANLTLDSDNFFLNERPLLIEHHGPHLPIASQTPGRKSPVVDPESVRDVLIIKLDHIGDFILSLPAIKMIDAKFPKARITLLAGSWSKPIAEKVPEIDNILTFNFFHEKSEKGSASLQTNQMEQLEKLLQAYHFDLAIDLRRHPETRKVLKLSRARYTVGYDTMEDDSWLTISLKHAVELEDIIGQKSKSHITTQLCQLVQAIDTNNLTSEHIEISIPTLSLPDKEPSDSLKRYLSVSQTDYLVGIHPGAGSSIRQWPISYFAHLADLLIERNSAHVILFGGKEDKTLAAQICDQMHYKNKVVSLAGVISLEEFLAMVRSCHLFIGNNSGPCHIAGVMGVPTLTIFSGQVLPHEWHPIGDKTMSIRVGLHCAPCYKSLSEQCPYDLKCLKYLWPEKVLEAATQLLYANSWK